MKNILLLLTALLCAINAYAQEAQRISCRLPGCTVECELVGKQPKRYGPFKRVTISIYPSGVMEYELTKANGAKDFVHVGPDSYMCTVSNGDG